MKKDFGCILEAWEGKNRQEGAAKEVQAAWLDRYGVKDKDAVDFGGAKAVRPEKLPIDDEIDLHGMTADEAEVALERFFERAVSRGFRKILIIHGKGNHSKNGPVLQRLVQTFIEKTKCAGKSGKEKAINGGSGATWVLIKKA